MNLLIVAVSQMLMYLFYYYPLMGEGHVVLSGNLCFLFIIDTVLIAAGGYVINDIFDYTSDIYNKPQKVFIGESILTIRAAWYYYALIVFVGFIIASYIAFSISKMHLLMIYPVAIISLFFYSKWFKKIPIVGNIIVAIFCAFVPAIVLYAEWDMLLPLLEKNDQTALFVCDIFIAYVVFAFMSTLMRELIKDIEDMEGDLIAKYKTLPIVIGEKKSRRISFILGLLLLISYVLWVLPVTRVGDFYILLTMVSFLFLTTLIITYSVLYAQEKKHYSDISKRLKLLMILSLLVFLLIPFTTHLF